MKRLCASLVLAVGLASAAPAAAIQTPFSRRIHEAIEGVIQYFRNQQGGNGALGNVGATGLAAMCMMEKRASADFFAPHVGYEGMDADDQLRVRNAIRAVIDNDPALNVGANPYSYGTGSSLMALSLFKATGGPDDVGAQVMVTQGISNAVRALKGTQGNNADCNAGGWNYNNPGQSGDLSTTQFAMAGLGAAASVQADASDTLERTTTFLEVNQARVANGNGGLVYQACGNYAPSHSMTASGIWCFRLSGLAASDDRVQAALGWMQQNYQYDRQTNWWNNSFYYYLWAAAKGLAVSSDDGMLGQRGVFEDDIGGVRDPVVDGFPEEPANWYYDFAWLLTEEQLASGTWTSRRPNGSGGQDSTADPAFACLVLERSLGGVCLDLDEDGLCEMEDNCPERFNPDQQDSDFDGVGDACDNCRLNPNFGQEDSDNDGVGDACDKVECEPTNDGIEICDGDDNDCNGLADDVEGIGELCSTGLPGVCAMGRLQCVGGEEACLPVARGAREEVCDLLDNDCDGQIDEGVRNACGRCGSTPAELCNGLDDDCDRDIDEGELCEAGETCSQGVCAVRCEDGGCPGRLTCRDGYCLDACAGVVCGDGQVCDAGSGDCLDPCGAAACDPGQVCRMGRCGSCLEVGCPADEMCVAGACVEDPCFDVECGRGQGCHHGACEDSCATLSCPLFQSCLGGVCVRDPCGGVVCGEGEACAEGVCGPDPCLDDEACAAQGQVCAASEGGCVDDPCLGVACGEDERCEPLCIDGECRARCVADWRGDGGPVVDDCDPQSPLYDPDRCQGPTEGEGEGPGEGEGEGEGPGEGEGEGAAEGEGEGAAEGEGEGGGGDESADTGRVTTADCNCRAGSSASASGALPALLVLLGLAAGRRRP